MLPPWDRIAAARGPLILGPHDVHVWYAFEQEITDIPLLAAYRALLPIDEQNAVDRYVFPRHRHQALITRAMMRTVPSLYAPVPPREWVFTRNAHGKPEIAGPAGVSHVRVNLSNTDGLVACAVTAQADVGVDVEDIERAGETVSVAERVFSPSEVRALRALPSERRRERFFHYWTLKETYIKARGLGLAIPLDQFSFHLDEGRPIRISFGPAIADDSTAWHFELHRVSARHQLAIGVKIGRSAAASVHLDAFVPLRDATLRVE